MESKGEHPTETRQEIEFPFPIPVQKHLSIAGRPKDMTRFFQLLFQALEVVDLSIESDLVTTVSKPHWLPTCYTKIQYGKASMPKSKIYNWINI